MENIDFYSFRKLLEFVISPFSEDRVLLLPVLFDKYKVLLQKNINDFEFSVADEEIRKLSHSSQWIFKMVKAKLGKSLLFYVPKKKNLGRMLYRNGTDILNGLHSLLSENQKTLDQRLQKQKQNQNLTEKIASLISGEIKKDRKEEHLEGAVHILRSCVKIYTSDKNKKDELLDIHDFNTR